MYLTRCNLTHIVGVVGVSLWLGSLLPSAEFCCVCYVPGCPARALEDATLSFVRYMHPAPSKLAFRRAAMADACSRLLVDSVPRSELLRITQLQSEMSRPPPETLPRTHGTS